MKVLEEAAILLVAPSFQGQAETGCLRNLRSDELTLRDLR
jgi:hypothetical protein